MKRLLRLEWDIIAGIAAAVVAVVAHLLHIVELDVLITIVLVLLALLLLRDLRRESQDDRLAASVQQIKTTAEDVQAALTPPDAILVVLVPKIRACDGRGTVAEPRWRSLPETLSFVLADVEPHGRTEALLSFWGEPFMSRATNRQAPRYIFRIQSHSDLIARLVELEREHRLGR